jgi:hypothetical protein
VYFVSVFRCLWQEGASECALTFSLLACKTRCFFLFWCLTSSYQWFCIHHLVLRLLLFQVQHWLGGKLSSTHQRFNQCFIETQLERYSLTKVSRVFYGIFSVHTSIKFRNMFFVSTSCCRQVSSLSNKKQDQRIFFSWARFQDIKLKLRRGMFKSTI